MCIGDFNEKLCSTEKLSSRPVSSRQLDAFREALELCQLADLGSLVILILGTIGDLGLPILGNSWTELWQMKLGS